MAGAPILQLRDTMSLRKADLGLVSVSEHGNQLVCLHKPQQSHPLSPLHEPLHWRAKKHKCFFCSPFYVEGVSLGHVGRNQILKDLKDLQSFLRKGVSLGHVGRN